MSRNPLSRADEHRESRWREDIERHAAREASRVAVRGRIAELASRIHTPAYAGREADIIELDRLWLDVARWQS